MKSRSFEDCMTVHLSLMTHIVPGIMRPDDLDYSPFDLEMILQVALAVDKMYNKFELCVLCHF